MTVPIDPTIVNVVGTRGGIGTTTFAIALGVQVAARGHRTRVVTPARTFDYVAWATDREIVMYRHEHPRIDRPFPDVGYDGFGESLDIVATEDPAAIIYDDDDDVDVVIYDREPLPFDPTHRLRYNEDDQHTIVLMTDTATCAQRLTAVGNLTAAVRYATGITTDGWLWYPYGDPPVLDLTREFRVTDTANRGRLAEPFALDGTRYAVAVAATAATISATAPRPTGEVPA